MHAHTHTATCYRSGIKSQEMQGISVRPVLTGLWDLNLLQVHIYLCALYSKCIDACTASATELSFTLTTTVF